jgi:hypothetical protein
MAEQNEQGVQKIAPKPELPDNPIEGFRSGARLDLRTRFAMELLVRSPIYAGAYGWPATMESTVGDEDRTIHARPRTGEAPSTPAAIARHALDVATALFEASDERGLVKPLGEMDEHLEAHIRRQISFENAVAKERRRQADEAAKIPQAVHRAVREMN